MSSYYRPETLIVDFFLEGVLCQSVGDSDEGNGGVLDTNMWADPSSNL